MPDSSIETSVVEVDGRDIDAPSFTLTVDGEVDPYTWSIVAETVEKWAVGYDAPIRITTSDAIAYYGDATYRGDGLWEGRGRLTREVLQP